MEVAPAGEGPSGCWRSRNRPGADYSNLNAVTSGDGGASTEVDFPTDDPLLGGGLEHLLVEHITRIIERPAWENSQVNNSECGLPFPMPSADGRSLAFVRDHRGQGQLMARSASSSGAAIEVALTPSSLNVYEVSFLSEMEYAFSAECRHPPQVFLNGRWMEYSHFDHGVWNLWLRDEKTGAIPHIGNVP